MALSVTELANYDESGGAATSKTTGTLSIPASSLILVFAHCSRSGGSTWPSNNIEIADSIDSTTGWSGLDTLLYDAGMTSSSFAGAARLFAKSFVSSTSRTITVNRSSGSAYWGYSVVAVTGHDTVSPTVQAKGVLTQWDDGGNAHSQAVTLNGAPTSGNAVISFLGCNNDTAGAATPPAGFTALNLPSAIFQATSVAYHTATTADTVTWSDCGQQIEYGAESVVEIKAASGGGSSGTAVAAWLRA